MIHQYRRNAGEVLNVVQAVIGDLTQGSQDMSVQPDDDANALGKQLGLDVSVADGAVSVCNPSANVFGWIDGCDYDPASLSQALTDVIVEVRDGKATAVIDIDVTLENIGDDCAVLSSRAMHCSFPIRRQASPTVIAGICREAADLWLAEGEATTVKIKLTVSEVGPRLH